jgi:hypothetical protein
LEVLQVVNGVNKVASFLGDCDPNDPPAPADLNLPLETARCQQVVNPINNHVYGGAVWSYHFTRGTPPAPPKIPDLTAASADVRIKVPGIYVFKFLTDLPGFRFHNTDRTIRIHPNGAVTVFNLIRDWPNQNNQQLLLTFQPDVPGGTAGVITAVLSNIVAHEELLFRVIGPLLAPLPIPWQSPFKLYHSFSKPANLQQCDPSLSNDPGWWVREP